VLLENNTFFWFSCPDSVY